MTNPWTNLDPPADTTGRTPKMLAGYRGGTFVNGGPVQVNPGIPRGTITITWYDHEPRAYYNNFDDPPFSNMGYAPGGRFRVEVIPPGAWKALKVWVVDPTANAGSPDGYWFSVVENQGDAQPLSAARFYNLSTGQPPFSFWVSSLRYEKRILYIQPYPRWSGGTGAGAPYPTLSYPLCPPPLIEPVVTMERHDGSFSTRWRKISFSADAPDWRKNWGVVVGEVLSATSFRSTNVLFPNGTAKFKPGLRGRDVWLYRPELEHGKTFKRMPARSQEQGGGQWRKILSVSNDGTGSGIISYEAPFDPPLSDDPETSLDGLSIIDKCVMWRATGSLDGEFGPSLLPGEFQPTLGTLFIDTWRMLDNKRQGESSHFLQHPDQRNWLRRLNIEYYLHNAGYADDGDNSEDGGEAEGYVDEVGATFPPTAVRQLSIRAHRYPSVGEFRLMESHLNEGMLRVEVSYLEGDVNRWQVYACNTSTLEDANEGWPTTDGQKWSEPDPKQLVWEGSRYELAAETAFEVDAIGQKVILLPFTIDGERGIQRLGFRLGGPETRPIIHSVVIEPDDDELTGSNNVIRWQWNGAAEDLSNVLRIWHHRENEEGVQHGENPMTLLFDGTSGTVDNPFTHDGTTPGARIDFGRGAGEYAVTHVYDIVLYTSDGLGVRQWVRVKKTDSFSGPDVPVMGALYASVESDGALEPNNQAKDPLTVNLRLVGARNLFFQSQPIVFEFSTDGLPNEDGGKVWSRVAALARMDEVLSAGVQRHQIWDKRIGGAEALEIVYRAYWGTLNDIVYSNVLNLLVSSNASPF